MSAPWSSGNQLQLLENGEEFFPAVFGAIASARHEVLLETFILFEDKVGLELQSVLIAAARRGVRVDMLVDGFGSAELTPAFVGALTEAGVRMRVFDPGKRVLGQRLNVLRRMHRKIVVVDGERAFVGGINYSLDHLAEFGPQAKQDYSMEVRGPVVEDIHRFTRTVFEDTNAPRPRFLRRFARHWAEPAPSGGAQALFVTRDNHEHRNDIERHYRAAIRTARERVLIANAYFFPGYLLLREMRRAAKRGVRVDLILQGEPDMPIVKTAANLLYEHLQQAGVRIHEYCTRPLHGKVAVVDDIWATVGSSNLDPLSLSLNLEANVVVRDKEFARTLGARLDDLITHSCKEVPRATADRPPWWAFWRSLRSSLVFHFLRGYPLWALWLPRHRPQLQMAERWMREAGGGQPAAENTAMGEVAHDAGATR